MSEYSITLQNRWLGRSAKVLLSPAISPPTARITLRRLSSQSKTRLKRARFFFRRFIYMKVLVLGATGGTGRQIISQAIERGHSVTAFVRAPDPLKLFGDRIVVIQGDLLNRSELKRVLEGRDAVLSSFGPRIPVSKEDATLLQRFGRSSDRPD
jgi:NAD(P)H-binding